MWRSRKSDSNSSSLRWCRELAIFNRSRDKGLEIVNLINEQTNCQATFYELSDEEVLKEQLMDSYLLINATNIGMADLEGESFIKNLSTLHESYCLRHYL